MKYISCSLQLRAKAKAPKIDLRLDYKWGLFDSLAIRLALLLPPLPLRRVTAIESCFPAAVYVARCCNRSNLNTTLPEKKKGISPQAIYIDMLSHDSSLLIWTPWDLSSISFQDSLQAPGGMPRKPSTSTGFSSTGSPNTSLVLIHRTTETNAFGTSSLHQQSPQTLGASATPQQKIVQVLVNRLKQKVL